ncbi:MAG TPA: ATPase domain-containing protein [Candidatus Binataceae bacterium]|nr:ATPase domain-containing protein [Candidatus Binataceae bacterium]
MAASPIALIETVARLPAAAPIRTLTDRQIAEFSGVFRGRELTRKDRRLSSGIAALDAILDGGIVRGRVSEIVGRPGFGRTSLAASFVAIATRRGEVAAWIDSAGGFDPRSIAAAGADLSRILWVGADAAVHARDSVESPSAEFAPARAIASPRASVKPVLLAAEMILGAGGFGLVVIDLAFDIGGHARTLTLSAALRLARAAERSGAGVIVLSERRMCGTFAALSLVLGRIRPFFSRMAPGAPALFDGMRVEAYVARNKLGGSGQAAVWRALVDSTASASTSPASAPTPAFSATPISASVS